MKTEDEVVTLMQSSRTEAEWNANANRVKREFGQYPDWWYRAIVVSGLMSRTREKWNVQPLKEPRTEP